MKKILESKPSPAVLEAVEKLRKLGFNPVFLSSEKCNINQLRALRAVSEVKAILKELSKSVGIYRKRLLSATKPTTPTKSFANMWREPTLRN